MLIIARGPVHIILWCNDAPLWQEGEPSVMHWQLIDTRVAPGTFERRGEVLVETRVRAWGEIPIDYWPSWYAPLATERWHPRARGK